MEEEKSAKGQSSWLFQVVTDSVFPDEAPVGGVEDRLSCVSSWAGWFLSRLRMKAELSDLSVSS